MKKPIISSKNEKVGEILVIIILFTFDETSLFSLNDFVLKQGLKYILFSTYSLNYKYNKNNILRAVLIKCLEFVNVFYSKHFP